MTLEEPVIQLILEINSNCSALNKSVRLIMILIQDDEHMESTS